ncbi:DNA-binding transcriptional MerR regulator [Streptacidiphilus sp. EB103A]
MATDGMLSTREVADLCRVTTAAVRQWRRRGHITADGLDERGRPLYRQLTAARAEAKTRSKAGRLVSVAPIPAAAAAGTSPAAQAAAVAIAAAAPSRARTAEAA